MSTSLARQLEQLRTSTTQSTKPGTTSLASTGPNILDLKNEQELSIEQLELFAKDAFKQLAGNVQIVEKFQRLVFKDDTNEEDDIEMDDVTTVTIENLIVILSPYLRQKSVQFLLQYLNLLL